MTAKTSTFAGQLEHFAQSVDIVDERTFDDIRCLVCQYVEVGIPRGEHFELLRERRGNGSTQRRLETLWSSQESVRHTWEVGAVEGAYTNPVTAAFKDERSMWIVSPDRRPLTEAEEYVDLWSRTPDIPRYSPTSSPFNIRTLIVVPLSFTHLEGAYCIESSQFIEITEVAISEMNRLARALGTLFGLWDAHHAHSRSKTSAIEDLRRLLQHSKFPKLAKPHIFVASSEKADERIKEITGEVLSEFSEKLETTDWERIYESGSVTAQVTREILESRFGICYLSEPDEESGRPSRFLYRDNPNVLFEAGMLHASTSASADSNGSGPTGWIPIREASSPQIPFDFASERILNVPRDVNGKLDEQRFREELRRRVRSLLQEP